MGELKPIGSEKLSGDAKLKRILELTYYQSTDSKTKSSEIVKESKTGVYGIVKEKDGYYVKKGLTENSLDYIGGLFMKNKNKFSSYGEALKKLEFLTEQEVLTEATKYVLKQNKPAPAPAPQEEAPAPMPTTDTATPPPPPAPDATGGAPAPDDMSGEETPEDPNDFMKVIQKMTGRLTQKLNTYQDKLESKDIKYVINMVLAAVDLDKMEESDKDEILSKLEGEDDDEGAEPTSDFPTDDNGEVPAPQEEEMSEVDGIAALDELINSPFDDDDNDYPELGDDDDDFLNDPEIKKAGKFAKKDIKKEFGDPEKEENDDNPLNATDEFPLYTGDEEEKDIEEQDPNDPTSGPEAPAEERLEEDPMADGGQMNTNLMGNDGLGEEDKGDVKELDIDELTNMVNTSVKETLSKYFN